MLVYFFQQLFPFASNIFFRHLLFFPSKFLSINYHMIFYQAWALKEWQYYSLDCLEDGSIDSNNYYLNSSPLMLSVYFFRQKFIFFYFVTHQKLLGSLTQDSLLFQLFNYPFISYIGIVKSAFPFFFSCIFFNCQLCAALDSWTLNWITLLFLKSQFFINRKLFF